MARIKWTDDMLAQAASEFTTRYAFQKQNNRAYDAAKRRGLLDKICKHMKQSYTYWTDDMLMTEAKKYTTRGELKNKNIVVYQLATTRGILDSICSHMTPVYTNWTNEMIKEEANKYTNRLAFQKGNENAYASARSRGILDEVCQHMVRGKSGFDPTKPSVLYLVILDSPHECYVGFGVSNKFERRLNDHIRNSNRAGFSFVVVDIIEFKNGKDASDIERKLKHTLPIVDSGVDGFKTEAVLKDNAHILFRVVDECLRSLTTSQSTCT